MRMLPLLCCTCLIIAVEPDQRAADRAALEEAATASMALERAWILANRLNQPSVVAISTRERRLILSWDRRLNTQELPSGEGSGFVVASDARASWVLTNAHVVVRLDGNQQFLVERGSGRPVWHDRVQVDLDGGDSVDAVPVGADLATDLAVLRLPTPNLPAVQWADSDTAEIGTAVLALGFPFGVGYSASRGIVSGTGRETGGGAESYENYLQTDAAINPGNSGGPLIDLRGRVLGVNTSIYSRTGSNIGIGFALPGNLARRVAEDLIDDGVVSRPVVGLHVWIAEPAQLAGVPNRRAVAVTMVKPGSPAEQAGVRVGDLVLAIDGVEITGVQHFRSAIASGKVGQPLRLNVWRDGSQTELSTVPISRDELERQMRDQAGRRVVLAGFGLELEQDDQPGLRIDRVAPDSPAGRKGLQSGDRIYAIHGLGLIDSIAQVRDLDQRTSIIVEVLHQGRAYLMVLQK